MIERFCDELDYVWRERTLGPVVTIHAFLMQVLHGNTACDRVSHLMGRRFTGEAYAQARARLPLALFERLLSAVGKSLQSCRDEAERWCGLRVWLLDGSGCSMSDTEELQKAFGQPGNQKPGCGFPVAHLLTLFHATTGMLQKVIVSPLRTHDLKHASQMHPELSPGDVLVGDRGYAHPAEPTVSQAARRQGTATVAVGEMAGTLRSHRRMEQAQAAPQVAGRDGLCGAPAIESTKSRWSPRCWTRSFIRPRNSRSSTSIAGALK